MGKYSIFDCVLLQLYWCSGHLVPAWPHLSLSDPLSVIISNPTFPHSEISSISLWIWGKLRGRVVHKGEGLKVRPYFGPFGVLLKTR